MNSPVSISLSTLSTHTHLQSPFRFVPSCSLWLKYGLLTDEKSVTVVNLVGSSLFLSYVITFFVFTTNKKLLFRQFSLVILVLITILFYSRHEPDQTEMARVLGIVCCTVTVLFFAAPLSKILHVVRTRNSECLPFPMIVANLIVCVLWVVYGVAIDDKFIQVGVIFILYCLRHFTIYSFSRRFPISWVAS